MIGAIAGDMIGSTREFLKPPIKTKDFHLFTPESTFTDDTVMTCSIAWAILNESYDYKTSMYQTGRSYLPNDVGWGESFYLWLVSSDPKPYNSWGNGSAMRVAPVGWAFNTKEEVLNHAELTALPSHNHLEGIKGAQAIALCIYLVRNNYSNDEIKKEIETMFGYDLNRTVDSIRPTYRFEVSCQKSVPEAIICFLEASSFEDAIRNAISLGGDTDTQGAMTGSIAEARWGVPYEIKLEVFKRLDDRLKRVAMEFDEKYVIKG